MDTEDVDGTDFDKTFIEEPAILDKYKAAAEVCESTYHHSTFYFIYSKCSQVANRKQACQSNAMKKHYIIIINDCSVLIQHAMLLFANFYSIFF